MKTLTVRQILSLVWRPLLLAALIFAIAISGMRYQREQDLYARLPPNTQNKTPVAVGIDISEFQEEINFRKVKRQGYRFAIIRAGFGVDGTEDEKFREHVKKARAAGLAVGVYYYSHAITVEEAVQEADFVLDLLDGKKLDLPVFYDVETQRQDVLDNDQLTLVISAFLSRLNAGGYTAGVYANRHFFSTRLNLAALSASPLWIANYIDVLDYEGRYDFWQFTNEGDIAGIEGPVDIDICFNENYMPQ